MPRGRRPKAVPSAERPADSLRALIAAAMELEKRAMRLYCRYERRFTEPDEVRAFWLEMAEHESRHYGALAMVAALVDCEPGRPLPAAPALADAKIENVRGLLDRAEAEAEAGISLSRAFETALAIEGSEIEELLLGFLSAFKGESERARAAQLLIHDLADLSYMIERFSPDRDLLARVDNLVEEQVERLRQLKARPAAPKPRVAARQR